MKKRNKILYIIHCIDTEGPLYESLEATFERIYDIFGIRLEATKDNLIKLQRQELDLGEKAEAVAKVFDPHYLNYNDTWEKLDNMLKYIMQKKFRNKICDSFGGGWIYNWFCLDHTGYLENPRRRDIGIHKIFDHYKQITQDTNSTQDGIHWHFHPMSVYRQAHRCATSYINSPHLYEVLCKRVIERRWFPAVFRAGFHAERPDSHWFLEQWIPFDASNWAYEEKDAVHASQDDISGGRLGDWRLAPADWSLYHPSHDNYQLRGDCRRWICRALEIKVRGKDLSQYEVEKAFIHAAKGEPTIMGLVSHDFRDIAHEVELARDMVLKASKKYPNIKFQFCEARQAFRLATCPDDGGQPDALGLDVSLGGDGRKRVLFVKTVKGRVFGPQPFLAIKLKSGRFIYDNFDFDISLTKWSYTFDNDSIRADDIGAIGVASNDKYGNTFVKVIDNIN